MIPETASCRTSSWKSSPRPPGKKDLTLKLAKYQNAGVKEYWIIDPEKKCLIIYDFTDEEFVPAIHPLEGSVPVAISGGELLIDLAPAAEAIEELENLE